ncbi:hypothetical protein ULO1_04610 [Carboxydocella sp. ULO1]|nr:hypothetical protein ULO1_04610 [Carboxydocella sp. ULO1]
MFINTVTGKATSTIQRILALIILTALTGEAFRTKKLFPSESMENLSNNAKTVRFAPNITSRVAKASRLIFMPVALL